ncbi:MAG TPA: DNA polymerase III subunit gamma/tau [Candidatus Limnocylindrales bacterium]
MTEQIPHQALYRRWRAQTFSEIVGQEAVVATLRNAVATGKVSHAILFTGPRGTGKTSLARILAKALNCTDLQPNADPCDRCPSCVAIREGRALDLVEIDAASNRGIEAVRDLRERLAYAPTDLRRKVYILDEAHQITKDAWNALLKSLEEPPEFVSFMFASTHPQEFPPAILSRLQRFDVRRLTIPEITGKLERILAADGREVDPEAIAVIARLAAGGMRDAESILDQLLASTVGPVTADAVRDLLGLADAETVDAFVTAMADGDAAGGIALLDGLEDRGRDLRVFLDQVVDALRDRLIAGLASGASDEAALVAAARRLGSIDPTRLGPGGLRLQLELALLDPAPSPARVVQSQPAAVPAPQVRTARPEPAPVARPPTREPARPPTPVMDDTAAAPEPVFEATAPPAAAEAAAAAEPATADATAGDDLERLRRGWSQIIAVVSKSPALKPLIDACRPISVDGNVVTLGFPEEKDFMREIAEKKRAGIEEGIAGYLGHPVGVRCVVSNLDLLPPLPDDADAAHIMAEAQRIFAEDIADVREVT